MKIRVLVIILVGMIAMNVQAQKRYTIEINLRLEKQAQTQEAIYITGNFNTWNPKDERYKLTPNSERIGEYYIQLNDIPQGVLEYKFTRGSWQTLECSPKGRLINLHDQVIEQDEILQETIYAWRDQYPVSTAPEGLIVLENFIMPELNRTRAIRIYLPRNYKMSQQAYPVWYMHDGQDLFDEATSEGRLGPVEWGIDETLERLGDHYIIVGIDHEYEKNRREREYAFFPTSQTPMAEGKQYLSFIVHTLKPYIDANYRTRKDKESTGIAGGSLGGLISLYAGLTYPEVFGKVGVFSPSLWQDQQLQAYMDGFTPEQIQLLQQQQYFFYAGGRENRKIGGGEVVHMDQDVLNLVQQMEERFQLHNQVKINPMGKHGAWYWQQAFSWMIELDNQFNIK
ncbi:alpha/beta hydrolase [Myroides sp. 1354]|uniref:alpha/beta hydrolase n=1 Tax=unclassified Myroides TaxID=2642485 RepID=UPI002579036C|nr:MULTISPECIES: alpha/beta hydrolase-fold protein [unclassified Myroides]MDM1044489.1 alpha/beta hydrolase [Myroides sp. R163-1]MDM1056810.1 alpha/beta hydrolase [Myroides sp. 1354]MDM1069919.1 alpha/beta hydrolase [Myroides sp. 1372]